MWPFTKKVLFDVTKDIVTDLIGENGTKSRYNGTVFKPKFLKITVRSGKISNKGLIIDQVIITDNNTCSIQRSDSALMVRLDNGNSTYKLEFTLPIKGKKFEVDIQDKAIIFRDSFYDREIIFEKWSMLGN